MPRWRRPGTGRIKGTVLAALLVAVLLFAGATWVVVNATVLEPRNRAAATAGAKSYAFGRLHYPLHNWPCLERLWQRESGWSRTADNPTSTAFGIPQAMLSIHFKNQPARRAAYKASYRVQVNWGLRYIWGKYRNPCRALVHSNVHGWY